jgi:hypothetical protein
MLKVGDLVRLKDHPTNKHFWVGVVKKIVCLQGYADKAEVFWPSQDKVYVFLMRDLEKIS